jgi:phosphatidylglycerol:prolipoprotein diacylglycerol transferase
VKPIPVVFHLGPLAIHTYGIGLAVTFWFGYRYFARRLRSAGYRDDWLSSTFVLIVISAIIGARIVHVIANLSFYQANPSQILQIWNGGLSSFGGLGLAIPVGFISARQRCPELRLAVAADLVAPVLTIAWAMGRLLGPQLMIAGGGKATTDWFGMYYAGEVGRRLPVPIFQAFECSAVYVLAILVERTLRTRGGPVGLVCAVAFGLWNLSRFFDEYLWLGPDNGTDAVEVIALVLFGLSLVVGTALLLRQRGHRSDYTAEITAPVMAEPDSEVISNA